MTIVSRACRAPGFTLIELLIAVAIIAVLAGLSAVAIGSVRRSVDGAGCANNLRTIGLAIMAYAAESNGRSLLAFPYAANDPALGGGGNPVATANNNHWPRMLMQGGYLDRVNVQSFSVDQEAYFVVATNRFFVCPTVKNDPDYLAAPSKDINGYQSLITYPMSHYFNLTSSWSNGVQTLGMNLGNGQSRKLTAVVSASIVPYVVDRDLEADSSVKWSFLVNATSYFVGNGNWANQVGPGRLHGNGSNVLYCDGRVAHVAQTVLKQTTSADVKWKPLQ